MPLAAPPAFSGPVRFRLRREPADFLDASNANLHRLVTVRDLGSGSTETVLVCAILVLGSLLNKQLSLSLSWADTAEQSKTRWGGEGQCALARDPIHSSTPRAHRTISAKFTKVYSAFARARRSFLLPRRETVPHLLVTPCLIFHIPHCCLAFFFAGLPGMLILITTSVARTAVGTSLSISPSE